MRSHMKSASMSPDSIGRSLGTVGRPSGLGACSGYEAQWRPSKSGCRISGRCKMNKLSKFSLSHWRCWACSRWFVPREVGKA